MARRTRAQRAAARRTGSRCPDCKNSVRWIRLRGGWRTFHPTPVDGRRHTAAAYPVENNGRVATPFVDLVEDVQVRLGVSQPEAEDHVYAMPWYALHACPTTTTSKEDPR